MKGLELAPHGGTTLDESEYVCESSLRCDLNRSGLLFTLRVWSFIVILDLWVLSIQEGFGF